MGLLLIISADWVGTNDVDQGCAVQCKVPECIGKLKESEAEERLYVQVQRTTRGGLLSYRSELNVTMLV